jgi:cyclopropane-fatty-acyl-phospholipid synthase
MSSQERAVREMLARGGIEVNGPQPWDIQVYDNRFYDRLLAGSSLGGGEAYMDGWWDVEALDVFFHKLEQTDPYGKFGKLPLLLLSLKSHLLNCQSRLFSTEVANKHYNLGNDLYEGMLDKHMQYTCGYWKDAADLDAAQENKLHLICRKLNLEKGMRVLELGGGFGGLARFMAANYGCQVVSYNISHAQVDYGRKLCAGLPVRIEEKDYREAVREPEPFDRVAAVGLCEHIGYKNYRGFLEVARARLRDSGLFLLHTIGANRSETYTDPWIDKYIFPNGMLPSVTQLGKAMEDLWIVEDWHNFGPDYDPTLMAWWQNFHAAWPSLCAKYGTRFYRMWRFYLLACAGRFRARKLQLWQIVLSKGDIASYISVR